MSALRHSRMLTTELITRASAGDEAAWQELVHRHAAIVWAVTRAHRLHGADAADVSQHTWAALAEHLPRLRRPDRLPGWLATTTRRECLRVKYQGRREIPTDVLEIPADPVCHTDEEEQLWTAFRQLTQRCRSLLGLLMYSPELTYVQVSRALGLKVTSLGRTRARCLDQLRRKLAILGGDTE